MREGVGDEEKKGQKGGRKRREKSYIRIPSQPCGVVDFHILLQFKN